MRTDRRVNHAIGEGSQRPALCDKRSRTTDEELVTAAETASVQACQIQAKTQAKPTAIDTRAHPIVPLLHPRPTSDTDQPGTDVIGAAGLGAGLHRLRESTAGGATLRGLACFAFGIARLMSSGAAGAGAGAGAAGSASAALSSSLSLSSSSSSMALGGAEDSSIVRFQVRSPVPHI